MDVCRCEEREKNICEPQAQYRRSWYETSDELNGPGFFSLGNCEMGRALCTSSCARQLRNYIELRTVLSTMISAFLLAIPCSSMSPRNSARMLSSPWALSSCNWDITCLTSSIVIRRYSRILNSPECSGRSSSNCFVMNVFHAIDTFLKFLKIFRFYKSFKN